MKSICSRLSEKMIQVFISVSEIIKMAIHGGAAFFLQKDRMTCQLPFEVIVKRKYYTELKKN